MCPFSAAQMFLPFLANTYDQRGCDTLDLLYLIVTQLFNLQAYVFPTFGNISAIISLNKFQVPFSSLFGGL